MYVLARAPYFLGLAEAELGRIDDRMQARTYAPDAPIYRAGDRAEALYVVAEGRVKLSQVTAGGTETVADILVPGELFGAMSSLGEPDHLHSASALVGSCVLRIEQADFRQVLAEQPRIALRVLDDVAARLARAQSDMSGQSTEAVPQRVATALLRLAGKLGQDRGRDGIMLEVPLTRRPRGPGPFHPGIRLPGDEPVEAGGSDRLRPTMDGAAGPRAARERGRWRRVNRSRRHASPHDVNHPDERPHGTRGPAGSDEPR